MITESQLKAALRKAQAAHKDVELSDGGGRGAGRLLFRARACASGEASAGWFAVYYRDARRAKTKLGDYPQMSLAEARKKFREEYAPTISAGAEPKVEQVRRRHAGENTSATVEELFRGYVDNLVRAKRRCAKTVEQILLDPKEGAARIIGADRLASSVAPEDIVAILIPIFRREAPAMASITRSYLHSAFNYGLKSPYDYRSTGAAPNYGVTVNPVTAVKRDENATKVGDRFLSPGEFRAYWHWLQDERKNSRVAYSELIRMAIGQRIEECLRMDKPGYDRSMRTFYWPETKNHLPHLVPLPNCVIEILEEIGTNQHGMFFPHKLRPDEPARMNAVDYLVRKFIRETGAEPFVPRDIRRTWKTLTGRAGIAKDIRDRIQNHTQNEDVSSRHYDRYDYLTEKRAAMATWEAFMQKMIAGNVGEQEDAVVVPMPGAVEVAA
jgi:integrase